MIEEPLYSMDSSKRELLYLRKTHFNIHYNITDRYNVVFGVLKRLAKVSDKEVWCIVTNTARAIKYNSTALSIPKHEVAYRGNSQGISYTKMMRLLDAMVEHGLLIYYKGGMNFVADRRYQSIYEFTPEYLELWNNIDTTKEVNPTPALIIRTRDTKKLLPTKGVSGVAHLKNLVDRFNDRLETTTISLGDVNACTQRYIRIYTDSISKGGRFYNTTGEFQTTSRSLRKEIKIDGSDVIELDFKAMHPSILYELAWQSTPDAVERWIDEVHHGVFDPYPETSPDIISRCAADNNIIRNLNKFAMLVGLNAHDFRSAQLAVSSEWYADTKRKNRKFGDLLFMPGINDVPVFPASSITRYVQDYNQPIAHALFCDAGLRLQNIESDIIGKVIDALLAQNELLLPVHDSIIVKKDIAAEATRLMRKSYQEIVGSDKFCTIIEG
jgi:hypothetical protein